MGTPKDLQLHLGCFSLPQRKGTEGYVPPADPPHTQINSQPTLLPLQGCSKAPVMGSSVLAPELGSGVVGPSVAEEAGAEVRGGFVVVVRREIQRFGGSKSSLLKVTLLCRAHLFRGWEGGCLEPTMSRT